MDKIKSKPGLVNFFKALPTSVKTYFVHVPELVKRFPLDVPLAYVLAQLETGQRMALYCGVVKIHSCNKDVAWKIVGSFHMGRPAFLKQFRTVYGSEIPSEVVRLSSVAQVTRDRSLHGKDTTDNDKRNAIAHALEYARQLNALVATLNGPRPFSDLRGFKGAGKPLPKQTSRWVLRGMGFHRRDLEVAGSQEPQ